MATYKVIQDIESEDKLLGPLSPRQFAYGAVTAFCAWMCYVSIARGAPFLVVIFIPPGLLAAFFAFPWGREQSTEVWALARVRFLFKPRKRIWNQTGVRELVTITVPKRIEKTYTDGLSQNEVKSRLQALATTIDSRGWAIKNTISNPYVTTPVFAGGQQSDERLINIDSYADQMPATETTMTDDILDTHNPKVQQFDKMLTTNAQEHRARLVASMQETGPVVNDTPVSTPLPQNGITNPQDEQSILAELEKTSQQSAMTFAHMPAIPTAAAPTAIPQNKTDNQQQIVAAAPPEPAVTQEQEAAILNLAHRNDLNISTIERTANKAAKDDQEEVVISLH